MLNHVNYAFGSSYGSCKIHFASSARKDSNQHNSLKLHHIINIKV